MCVFAERDGKQRNEGCGWEGRERSRACFVCEAWSVEGHLRYAERREREIENWSAGRETVYVRGVECGDERRGERAGRSNAEWRERGRVY